MHKSVKTMMIGMCLFIMSVTAALTLLHNASAQQIQPPDIYAVSNLGEVLDFKTIASLSLERDSDGFQNQRILPRLPQPAQGGVANFVPNIIIGPDERVKIADTTVFPWSTVVKIRGNFGAAVFECSGWMLGVSTVATAAHCIYDYGGTNVFASSVFVTPALNSDAANSTPFGTCKATQAWIVNSWKTTGNTQYDYGVFFVDCRIGEQTGNLGYRVMTDAQLNGELATVTGYPSDKGGTTMWAGLGRIVEIGTELLYYDNDTFASQSGGPVWELIDDSCQACVVAIHSGGTAAGDKNVGARVTEDVFDFLFVLQQKQYTLIYLPLIMK